MNSYEKRASEHINKRNDYSKSPYSFDNQKHLENAPRDRHQHIIQRRLAHLDNEIVDFTNKANKIKNILKILKD